MTKISAPPYKQRGVTLLEVMIVVAIIGILAAIAVPSYQDTIERNRLQQAAESLKSDLQFARTEAIKRSRDVHVSRSTGSNGTWCYGLEENADCNCGTTGDCSIKTVSGSDFSSVVSMTGTGGNSTFDFKRGTIAANGVTFETDHHAARVVFSDVGRVRVCTPTVSGKTGISNYPGC